jgi:predicted RNase H-like HicB family nuclease
MKFAVVLEPDEAGFIAASCPSLPWCHSQGRDRDEALANIREAIQGYVESMNKHGEPLRSSDSAVAGKGFTQGTKP